MQPYVKTARQLLTVARFRPVDYQHLAESMELHELRASALARSPTPNSTLWNARSAWHETWQTPTP